MLSCINPIETKFSSQELLATVVQIVYDISYKDVMNILDWHEYGNHVVSTNMLTKSTVWDHFEKAPFVLSDVHNLYV